MDEVVRSGDWWRNEGVSVERFERDFAELEETPLVLAVTSGTHALELALMSAGIEAGARVIVPAATFFSTWSAVQRHGATAVLADIDLDTWTLDPTAASAAAAETSAAAVVPVHYGGVPAPLADLGRSAPTLIQDAAHGPGIRSQGAPLVQAGGIVCWSFQQSKLLPGGEGGAMGFADEATYRRALTLQNCGRIPGTPGYGHLAVASNFRMPELTSALLRAQLERFVDLSIRRANGASRLRARLAAIDGIVLQRARSGDSESHYLVQVRLTSTGGTGRDEIVERLASRGIPVSRTYPPLCEVPAYGASGYDPAEAAARCPNAMLVGRTGLSFHHRLLLAPPDVLDWVGDTVAEAVTSAAERFS
ncbi:3-amino-5-hydroxybenzoic acid synthase [Nocardioides zeae]|uniref:3-amino-5-hydroxybenzoic acid synthase n=1 Tax=Nocardioides zeae TaxID=1457234 RepID=A0A6P0HPL7_9ACTN|nr:3-amino-5-hydroxybenzoic acid synthase [Nocardioides zeae]